MINRTIIFQLGLIVFSEVIIQATWSSSNAKEGH